jgi:hypothetical protein
MPMPMKWNGGAGKGIQLEEGKGEEEACVAAVLYLGLLGPLI